MIENEQRPVVTVFCICYNHARYLRRALDSVVCQKTNFPFEILVHDDASTDDSPNIILEYQKKHPELIVPILQTENLFSKGINRYVEYMLPRTKGEFIAQLECDDFWCDEYKLQKQVDALRKFSECVACVHYTELCNEQGERNGSCIPKIDAVQKVIETEDIIQMVAQDNMFHTSSRMMRTITRKELEINKPEWAKASKQVGDIPQMLFLALQGKICFIPDVMSVYRLQAKGSFTEKIGQNVEYLTAVRIGLRETWQRFGEANPKYQSIALGQVEWYTKAIMSLQLNSASIKELQALRRGKEAKIYHSLEKSIRIKAWINAIFPWIRLLRQRLKRL